METIVDSTGIYIPKTQVTEQLSVSQNDRQEIAFYPSNNNGNLYETDTKENLFLKEYIIGKAVAKGITIPDGFNIRVSNYNGSKYHDILQGNVFKGVTGIQAQKYLEDAKNWITRNKDKNKSIEDYCREKGLTADETEKVIEYYRFHEVRVDIFGARIKDMFDLLSQNREVVKARVGEMKISDEDKNKILQVKDFIDKYYKIEAIYKGRTINLMNMSENDIAEIQKESPEFAKMLKEMQPELIRHTNHFAGKEMQGQELSDAGQSSRGVAGFLLGLLSFGLYKGYKEGKEMKEGMKGAEDFAKFIKENPKKGREILDKCVTELNTLSKNGTVYEEIIEEGYQRPWHKKALRKIGIKLPDGEAVQKGTIQIKKYMKSIGFEGGEFLVEQAAIHSRGVKAWVNPITKFKSSKGAALTALIMGTVMLSGDDCAGAVKDFFQDQNNFGTKTGLAFAGLGVLGGISSSAAFVPTFQNIVDYKRADGILKKLDIIPKLKGKQLIKSKGKWALLTTLMGVVLASTSSGSSWTSMLLTGLKMKKNGNELEKKGIISKADNTVHKTYNNMMEYEAYKGKKEGITYGPTGDWTIGSIGGALGLFTAVNPVVQNTFVNLQGCSETLTASVYQVTGNKARDIALEKEKVALLQSINN